MLKFAFIAFHNKLIWYFSTKDGVKLSKVYSKPVCIAFRLILTIRKVSLSDEIKDLCFLQKVLVRNETLTTSFGIWARLEKSLT